ncbi:MAG: transglycosylase domain-containing protein [bacterium]
MKRLFKYFVLFLIFITIFNFIDLFLDNVNHISDISNQNKVIIYDELEEIIYEQVNLHEASYVTIDNINEITKTAFIEIEDKRFYTHNGIDPITTVKAFFHNLSSDYTIGGSTITQQYVKNLYLSNEKTYIRKIKECYYAFRVESLYTKDEILEGYLNTIYFSNGIYGINDAARYYFNKTPNELSLKEAISLVSIIKSPTNYCLINNFENNQERAKNLLDSLLERNIISKKDYNEAIYSNLIITQTKTKNYSNSVLYFKDYVLKNINTSTDEINIYTNFNSELNLYIDNLISNVECDISIVVMDNNGYIVSTIGNKNYYESDYNISTSASRMIGSTIKPMLYYKALEFGISAADTFISEEKDFIIDDNVISISNFNNSYDNKPISMAYAIATSDNIYAMKTHLFIGTDKLPSFLRTFGIEPINDKYTISLGTQDMSLLSLASIYNTFQNLGYYTTPKGYTHYTKNNITTNNIPLRSQLLNSGISFIINDLLLGTFDTNLNSTNNVTGNSISGLLNKKVSAKSGLTDYDSYMIGYTGDYVVAIWTGHSDNSLLDEDKNKKLPKELFYKIINELPTSQNNIWDVNISSIKKKHCVILPNLYEKDLYFI